MQTEHGRRPAGAARDLVDVEIRCVGGEDRLRRRYLVERAENLALDAHILEGGFDDNVGVLGGIHVGDAVE